MDRDNLGIATFNDMIDALQKLCIESDNEPKFWTDGEKILSKDKAALNGIADMIDQLADYGICCTGYYDPEEDKRNDCIDEYTGYYWLELAE